jgi:hypothetical protein
MQPMSRTAEVSDSETLNINNPPLIHTRQVNQNSDGRNLTTTKAYIAKTMLERD